jgi:hypothetical protein
MWQEWKPAEFATGGGDSLRGTGKSTSSPSVLLVLVGVAVVGGGVAFLFALEESDVQAPEAEVVAVPETPDIDLDQVERELEGLPQRTDLGCREAKALYDANVDDDVVFEPVPEGIYGELLNNGTYLELCAVPETTGVEVCAAIQNGRAVGVTVSTEPADPLLETCVAARVRGLRFPSYPAMQVATTRFVPLEDETEAADAEPAAPTGPTNTPAPGPAAAPRPERLEPEQSTPPEPVAPTSASP